MRYIAMFLPQFHDCPFNSRWWGKGFTEWDNVRAARPLFDGHRQPRAPLEYYDLCNGTEIERQAALARDHGITGFAIYHYWYGGQRPLGRPLDLILEQPKLDLAFSLCWANHSWTRSWKNRSGSLDVLIEQTYERDSQAKQKHYAFLARAFSDARYIRVNGKPLLQIYVPEAIPDVASYIDGLREYCHRVTRQDIHVSGMVTAWLKDWAHLASLDSVTLFQPSLALFSPIDLFGAGAPMSPGGIEARLRASPDWFKRIIYTVQDALPKSHRLFSYEKTWNDLLLQYEAACTNAPRPVFPMAFVDFDNTPRYRERARILNGYSSEIFARGVRELSAMAAAVRDDNIVFLNAWNEWGEGMYLEPDAFEQCARLEAVKRSAVAPAVTNSAARMAKNSAG